MSKARDIARAGTALSSVDATELGYLDGVTSNVQTQINAKLATATAASTYQPLVANVSDTEIGYLDGVTSAIQTQLNQKPEYVAGKNAVINGAFDIWQRGTSFTMSSTAFTADRWNGYRTTTSSTVSRQVTGDTTNLPNIQYCARVQRNNGNTSGVALYFGQAIETINSIPFAGQIVTLSFYARKGANYSETGSILSATLFSGTGVDQNNITGAYTGLATVATGNKTLTTTWQRFTISGTVATTATELTIQFNYTPSGTASTADYFEITGVQLELGSTATPFSRAGGSIGGELALCQRYYYRVNSVNSAYATLSDVGQIYDAGTAYPVMHLPTPLRTAVSSIDYANLSIFDNGFYAISGISINNYGAIQGQPIYLGFSVASSGMTSNRVGCIKANNTNSAYLGVGAEL